MAIRPLSKQGGIISKIRRRLTVQGESETIDGVLPARPEGAKEQPEEVEDVSLNHAIFPNQQTELFAPDSVCCSKSHISYIHSISIFSTTSISDAL